MSVAAAKPATEPQQNAGAFDSPRTRTLVFCLLLAVATLVLYNAVAHNEFVNFDDDHYVLANAHVRAGIRWSTISWAFTSLEQANWHPLTWISHAFDCQLFQINPAGHHYVNLLLHAANVLLVFLILQWFTGYTGRSLMVAALFAVHPVNVESVAWVAERKNMLCMFFFLLTVGAYGGYVRKPGVGRYLAVAALFAMGLMSKPMVITLPFVLLLLDYWPLGRLNFSGDAELVGANSVGETFADGPRTLGWLCLEKIPLVALSVGSAIVTMVAQKAGGAVVSTAMRSSVLRLENAVVCYVRYIGKALWPSNLAALYPYPHSLPSWEVAVSAVLLLAVTGAVLKYRAHRYLLVGWFWYLGTMVPMIGLVQVGNQAMADRYAYLPFLGLFGMVVWGVTEWAGSRHVPAKYLAVAGLVVVVGMSVVTHAQVSYWHDDLSLWSHALAVTQDNFVAENNFGTTLAQQGRFEEAIVHFRTAEALEPDDPESQQNLGIYAQQHGDTKQAAARYALVLRLATDSQIRGSAYANLGTIYFASRDYARARENFEAAIKLNRVFPVALIDLGLIAQKDGDWSHAIDYYARFASMEPSDVAFLLLAQALDQGGHAADGERVRQQAMRISDNIAQAQQTVDKLLGQ